MTILNAVGSNAQRDELQRVVAISDMFRLMSLVLRFPTNEVAVGFLNGALSADVTDIFEEIGVNDSRIDDIVARFSDIQGDLANEEEFLAELRREYTYLFNHPDKPAVDIYESQFLYRASGVESERPVHFVNPAALDAERCYRQADLTGSEDLREPADNMATEMEFMMYLFARKAVALEAGDSDGSERVETQIEEFSRIHLQKWALRFFGSVVSHSRTSAYGAVGLTGLVFMTHILPSSSVNGSEVESPLGRH
ncbi:MAG: molecular chaperone [Coriobacteriia bacterium]